MKKGTKVRKEKGVRGRRRKILGKIKAMRR